MPSRVSIAADTIARSVWRPWWVPRHTGLPGNEGARVAAARGILQSEQAPSSDICAQFRRAVVSWQDEWIATQKNIWRALLHQFH